MQAVLALGNTYENWESEFGFAARFARQAGATLTGTFVCPTPYVSGGMLGTADEFGLILQSIREAERRASDRRDAFEAWARGLGVRNPSWQVAEGNVPDVMRHLGNWHDFLVVRNGRTESDVAQLGAVTLHCGLPTLVVPADHAKELALDCVAVAWNGSVEAVRAIHAALPLLRRARRVVVLRGEMRDAYSEIGWLPHFDLATYWRKQDLQVVDETLRGADRDAGKALLDAAASTEANLLVMGAYGRNRFSEWMFGGATRHVFAHAAIPVFMRH